MDSIKNLNILVVGDIMLDKYVRGDVTRISPEAPVPVINITDEDYTLGGCGNVVRNLNELGVNVDCLASVAIDRNGEIIKDTLYQLGVRDFVIYDSEVTTVKKRVIANNTFTQMLRIDNEVKRDVNFLKAIGSLKGIHTHICQAEKYDVIIVSDYAKGMITAGMMEFLHTLNEKPKILVDPKPENAHLYKDVFMITPNKGEWEQIKKYNYDTNKTIKYILNTKGSKGMTLIDQSNGAHYDIKSKPRDIYNVSGAGDTVVAVMGICIALGIDLVIAAKIANECAGYVVTKPGTSTIPLDKFKKYYESFINT